MSITTEIERLKLAKSNLFTAITAKGGLLTAEQTISDYASAVDSIEINTGSDIDFTGVNVTADTLLADVTAINSAGLKVTGNIQTVGLTLNGNTVSIAKGYTEGGSVTVEGGTTTPASVTVNENIITITAGTIEAQTIEIPESEITETANKVTVGIGYVKNEQVFEFESGSGASVEYGYIDYNNNFQPCDMSVNPPMPIGNLKSVSLKTVVAPTEIVPVIDGFLRITGGVMNNIFETVTITSGEFTGTVMFTGGNPDTFDMYYFDDMYEVWKPITLNTPIQIPVTPTLTAFFPTGGASKIIDIKGNLGNDEMHQCKVVFTGFESSVNIEHVGESYTEVRPYSFEVIGSPAAILGGSEQLPEYAISHLFQDVNIQGWLTRVITSEDLKGSLDNLPLDVYNALTALELSKECYSYLFARDAYITNSGSYLPMMLPAEIVPEKAYFHMYENTSVPKIELMATTLSSESCAYMFKGCQNLNEIKVHFTQWHDTATTNWVQGVHTSKKFTFYKPKALPEIFDDSHIPKGWTVINYEDMEETE